MKLNLTKQSELNIKTLSKEMNHRILEGLEGTLLVVTGTISYAIYAQSMLSMSYAQS